MAAFLNGQLFCINIGVFSYPEMDEPGQHIAPPQTEGQYNDDRGKLHHS